MPAPELFCRLVNINLITFTKEESMFLEIEFFTLIVEELKNLYMHQHKDYFRLLKFTQETESSMIEDHFIRYIINDILSTEEYSLAGIAYYTQTPEEIIFEIAAGLQGCLSPSLLRKIIELHRMVRSELYQAIFKKCRNKVIEECPNS